MVARKKNVAGAKKAPKKTKNGNGKGSSSSGKWMIMCYIAGDNALSPLFVEQLKAIKNAGFARDVEVLVYFDANETGVATKIFNVNGTRKRKDSKPFQIGDDSKVDDIITDMTEDIVKLPRKVAATIGDKIPAVESFELFLDHCLADSKADHYMLFLLGHGMVVGNDAFLPDDFPQSGIKLKQLGEILNDRFGPGQNRSLELLGMHCCAMNAVEVLYELQGVAKYMIGSEGLAFVGAWEYRKLLQRFYKGLQANQTIETIIESLYRRIVLNSKDFVFAGYPLELSLCRLDPEKIYDLTKSLEELVERLVDGIHDRDDEAIDAIQLAHLKSQSYFDERYTDLYDFCFCLAGKCRTPNLEGLRLACVEVARQLEPVRGTKKNEVMKRFDALVIHSDHFGWSCQYSHGLSVFFPWSEPTRQSLTSVMDEYREYKFSRALGANSWCRFLEDYFSKTKRAPWHEERAPWQEEEKAPSDVFPGSSVPTTIAGLEFEVEQIEAWQSAIRSPIGGLPPEPPEKITGGAGKITGGSSTACDCPSIKNYPRNVL